MEWNPTRLFVPVEATPSLNDPANADEFYRALGIAMVAWGRLEGHFISGLLLIINIRDHDNEGARLPMKWERQAELWNSAFEKMHALKPLQDEAHDFLKQMNELTQIRNAFSHALWEKFFAEPPIGMSFKSVRPKPGTGDTILVRVGGMTANGLLEFAQRAGELNFKLVRLTDALSELRGIAPPGAAIL
jgi:hypothetical protein